jgi:DNA-binding response OmpR family regulator
VKTDARPAIDDGAAHRVLVVDDDAGLRDAIGTILETRFEVLTAESGEQALEILRKKRVDVVTLDLTMPGIGGLATLARLREMRQLVPVIILSGSGTDADFAAARKYGVADWLQKPFDPGELCEALARVIPATPRS